MISRLDNDIRQHNIESIFDTLMHNWKCRLWHETLRNCINSVNNLLIIFSQESYFNFIDILKCAFLIISILRSLYRNLIACYEFQNYNDKSQSVFLHLKHKDWINWIYGNAHAFRYRMLEIYQGLSLTVVKVFFRLCCIVPIYYTWASDS